MRLSSKEQKNLQKNKPYKGFSRFRTDLSLVGLTCALYVLFLIVIMLHKGIRITGAACNDQFFICLDILEGLNQISNALLRHQTTEEQYV